MSNWLDEFKKKKKKTNWIWNQRETREEQNKEVPTWTYRKLRVRFESSTRKKEKKKV